MTEQHEQPVNETTGAANFDDAVKAFIEHQKRAVEEGAKALESLLPEGFREHGKEAGREFMKGMKILVEAAVSELEKATRDWDKNLKRAPAREGEAGGDRPSTTGTQKVKVQVE